jgi:hypothetical protein
MAEEYEFEAEPEVELEPEMEPARKRKRKLVKVKGESSWKRAIRQLAQKSTSELMKILKSPDYDPKYRDRVIYALRLKKVRVPEEWRKKVREAYSKKYPYPKKKLTKAKKVRRKR